METVFPSNYDEVSNHYYHLGVLYEELEARPGLSKALSQRYHKNAREALHKCHAMRTVWYGPQHKETLKPQAKLQA